MSLIFLSFSSIFVALFETSLAFSQSFGNLAAQDKVAQDLKPTDVIHWQTISAEASLDGMVAVNLRLTTEQNFSIYKNKLSFNTDNGYKLTSYTFPPAATILDPITTKQTEVFSAGDFILYFQGIKPYIADKFVLKVTYLGCTTRLCLFPFTESLTVASYQVNKNPNAQESILATPISDNGNLDFESRLAEQLKTGDLSFLIILAIIFLGGILTNLTPCVYPMIPITIRILSRQNHSPFANAALYALGILVSYTTLGVFAALSGGMFGALMASVTFNLIFALMMFILGLTMLGYGNLYLLQQIGSRIGSGQSSARNTLLMGVGAGLVASPCTGPILATLLAYTAQRQNVFEGIGMMFTYSLGFALPYLFLGQMAAKISAIKVSHNVQLIAKLIFASVMFALALYYLRIPLYNLFLQTKSYQVEVMVGSLIIGLFASGIWIFKSSLQANKLYSVAISFILATGIFAGSQWITGTADSDQMLSWYKSEQQAFQAASNQNKPILVDGWAEWCEACKKMEASTFKDPEVIKILKDQWVLLKFDLTESNDVNDKIIEKYGFFSLPTTVLIPKDLNLDHKMLLAGYLSASKLLKELKQFKGSN